VGRLTAESFSTYRGNSTWRKATRQGLNKLRQAHRERAALQGVRSDYANQLDEEQKSELKKHLDQRGVRTVHASGAGGR